VLANSDSKEDQELKLKVRDQVINSLKNKLENSKNKEETKKILISNLDNIRKISEKIITENNYNYSVKVLIANDNFPTKEYGDIKLPAGNYETLKIIIGNGEGHNWWCVIFPPLCFLDITKKTVPNDLKNNLKNILPEKEYKLISSNNFPVKVKFKIMEVFNLSNKNKNVKKSFTRLSKL
jgi:stage II sporulation protein R